jgi:hypothetical protein
MSGIEVKKLKIRKEKPLKGLRHRGNLPKASFFFPSAQVESLQGTIKSVLTAKI